ncbi:hypothetical protein F0L68_36100 [Solihabitans fulvus]|uniref:Dirigent-like protein n=1 Tax=Solihabitans fulvus TaxID=1892852 RepID=A0A5B2WNB1_9PSEU|nr:hypothetical protein [Solihabitans fulvus]KAA2252464.1 hypothetical protein F0L68_36100 [Solihabitans fulvus]
MATKFLGRLGLLVAGAVVGLTASSVLPAATASNSREDVVKLIAKRSGFSLTSFPVNPLATFTANGDLLDAATSQRVGNGSTVCTMTSVSPLSVPPTGIAQCSSIYTLDNKGSIFLSSSRTYQLGVTGLHFTQSTMAITGGTDAYRRVRGDSSMVFQGGARSGSDATSYLVELRLSTD